MAGKAGPTRPWQGEGRMLKGLRTVAVMVALALPGLAAAQEDWPTRPITLIIPFPAGGQADIVTRVVTEKMAPILGQPILVEAKPGAAGNIGTAEVVKAAPDGYTWLSSGVPLTTAPAMYPTSLGFDPLNDLAPVIRFGDTSFVLAVPAELPVSSVAELVDYAKAHEGELSYAGSGIGSLVHLVSELFKLDAGIDVQMIPYNGQPPAIADLLANRVQFMVLGVSLAKPLVDENKLKALAIFDAERSEVMPEVPTIGEAGYPGLVANGWAGFNVPAGTPEAVIEKINAAVSQVISDPAVVAQVEKVGWQIVPPQTPAEFGTFLADEARRWGEVVAKAEVETN
jgi:tripartite-type tricarboxylate transporter receptor subunit TctC